MTAAAPPSRSLDVIRSVLAPGEGRTLRLRAVGGREPAFLVPPDARNAAAICTAYNGLRPPRRRLERRLVAAAMGSGLRDRLSTEVVLEGPAGFGAPADRGLLDELARRLGQELVAGIGLGRLDAYWKPVLQLFSTDGRPVAYAKVGWNPVTSFLVDTEARALEAVSGRLAGIVAPELADRFEWGDLLVAVTTPLPRDSRRLPDADPPPPPPAVERVDGDPTTGPLSGSRWWDGACARVVDGAGAAGRPGLPAVLAEAAERAGAAPMAFGRQHGDWVPWNLGRSRSAGGLVVWDWEYSAPWAPLGVDLLHGRYQSARLLRGATDAEAFAHAHGGRPAHLRLAHAAMIASRRCWAAGLGAADDAGSAELAAAAEVLESIARAEAS